MICSLGTGLTIPTTAQGASAGREPFNFLFLDADARPAAMGGAYTALAADANALLYNPAGLGALQTRQAVFMRNEHAADAAQDYAALALHPGFGLSINRLSYGAIPRTTVSNPDGAGSFTASDLALAAGYGRALGRTFCLGAGVKYLREAIDDVSASGYAADAGALYAPEALPALRLGIAAQNMGPAVRFQSMDEKLPFNIRAGAAYTVRLPAHALVLAADLSKERSENPLLGAGLEMAAGDKMAFRAGYNGRNQAGSGLTLGLGWMIWEVGLNYAFTPMGDLGNAHRISLALSWGEKRQWPAEINTEPLPEADEAIKTLQRHSEQRRQERP